MQWAKDDIYCVTRQKDNAVIKAYQSLICPTLQVTKY